MKLSLITNKALAQAATVDVVVEYDKEGKPKAGLKIVGPDSVQYLNAQVAQRVAMRLRGVKNPVDQSTEAGQIELDQMNQAGSVKTAIAVTVGWFGFENDDGTEAAFNPGMVPAIFEAHPSVKDSVIIALNREADFLPKAEAA